LNHRLFSHIHAATTPGPLLGFGAGFVNFAGFDTSVATVWRARELGLRYFDTSVLYRAGASQAILGEALNEANKPTNRDLESDVKTDRQSTSLHQPDRFSDSTPGSQRAAALRDLTASQLSVAPRPFLATKIGHFAEARHFRSPEAMLVQFRESLRLLRRDSVDLLQVHEADWSIWWEDRSEVRPLELFDLQRNHGFAEAPVVEFLRSAKAAGLCRHIGITGNNARHLARLVAEIPGLDSVLVAYNYHPLNVTARDALIPIAVAKNVAVIVAGVFTFVHRIPDGWRTEGTYFGRHADQQLAALQTLQKSCGLPMNELALRFVLAERRIDAILVGACRPAEIEENVARFALGPLPADLNAAIEAIARDV
jgi:D-threo-aldose 1-dehydrogenase